MKGLRADLIVLSILLSAGLHLGLMLFARQQVMIRVAGGVAHAERRGPMRVTEAPPPVETLASDLVRDTPSEKAAPAGDETVRDSAPLAESASLTEARAIAESLVPMLEAPSIPERLPEVLTSDAGEKLPAPAIVSDLPVALPTVAALPTPSFQPAEMPAAPRIDVPRGAFGVPPAQNPEPFTSGATSAGKQAFTPPMEVMKTVDEQLIAAEKQAVREMVNAPQAKDLSSAIEFGLTTQEAADGLYFQLQVKPKAVLPVVPKDVVILIDASGSIGRDRMGSIRGATKHLLRSASNTGDRFNLVAFRDRYSYAFRTWQPCTQDSFDAAETWLNNQTPFGRTDVFATIASVLTLPRDPARPLVALVITDGEANSGVSETRQILSRFTALNDGLVSLYMYGVKSSANRELIEVLTHGNRGESHIYADAGFFSRAHAGSELEPLTRRFRDPVLSDLRLVFASDSPAETYPRLLKNLYREDTLTLTGRVPKGTRELVFSLVGLNGASAYEGFFRLPLSKSTPHSTLRDIWRTERSLSAL